MSNPDRPRSDKPAQPEKPIAPGTERPVPGGPKPKPLGDIDNPGKTPPPPPPNPTNP